MAWKRKWTLKLEKKEKKKDDVKTISSTTSIPVQIGASIQDDGKEHVTERFPIFS